MECRLADLRPPRSKADLCVKRSERLLGAEKPRNGSMRLMSPLPRLALRQRMNHFDVALSKNLIWVLIKRKNADNPGLACNSHFANAVHGVSAIEES